MALENTLHQLEEHVEDEIKKVLKKGDLTPAEVANLKEAMCLLEQAEKTKKSKKMHHEYDEGESYAPYHMPHVSYGMGHREYGINGMVDVSEMEGASHRRGRSPSTGRYVSRDSGPSYSYGHHGRGGEYRYNDDGGMSHNYNSYEANHVSRHSIHDRIVSRLEGMYDEAKTDHERQVIDMWIKRIEYEG